MAVEKKTPAKKSVPKNPGRNQAPKKEPKRNPDGTWPKGVSGNPTGEGGGRPSNAFSFRAIAKIRAQEVDEKTGKPKVELAVDQLEKIALDPSHPRQLEALDKWIKLNGNYDPSESVLTGDLGLNHTNPALKELTAEELRAALLLKKSKGGKK